MLCAVFLTGADWRRGGGLDEAELELDAVEEVDLRFRRFSGCWDGDDATAEAVGMAVEIRLEVSD